MKCNRPLFYTAGQTTGEKDAEPRPELPDVLTDYLTGREIPFTNRDNIRQKVLKYLVEEKGYLKEDMIADREIQFELEDQHIVSPVDLIISLRTKSLMVWKCASGSLVSRERQVIAAARLLAANIVPFAAVTNGRDVELLSAFDGRIIASSFRDIPSRNELMAITRTLPEKTVNKGKLINEQRILYTYDAISCPSGIQTRE